MAIEFNNIGNTPIHNRVKQDKSGGEAAPATASQVSGRAQNEIQLSEQAQQLKSADSGVSSIDQAKVARIRNEISEGRYHIDPVKLAENFIALESELSKL